MICSTANRFPIGKPSIVSVASLPQYSHSFWIKDGRAAQSKSMHSAPPRLGHVLSMFVLLAMSGCASTLSSINESTPYPSTWPQIESRLTDDGCPILQGTYENQTIQELGGSGNKLQSVAEVIQRAMVAGRRVWPKSEIIMLPPRILAVTLTQSHDSLGITFVEPDGTSITVQLRRFRWASELEFQHLQKFHCDAMPEGPALRLMAPVDHKASSSLISAGGSDIIVWFYKAVDGSLVVRWQSQFAQTTMFLIGSGLRNDSAWLRFQPLDVLPRGAP